MNQDPVESLSAFYEECRTAPVPSSIVAGQLPAPWWIRVGIPFGGLSFGGLLALVLISMPSGATKEDAFKASQAIAEAQIKRIERQVENVATRTGDHAQSSAPTPDRFVVFLEALWTA